MDRSEKKEGRESREKGDGGEDGAGGAKSRLPPLPSSMTMPLNRKMSRFIETSNHIYPNSFRDACLGIASASNAGTSFSLSSTANSSDESSGTDEEAIKALSRKKFSLKFPDVALLDLSEGQLFTVPNLTKNTQLVALNLSLNHFKTLPANFAANVNLNILDLSNCPLDNSALGKLSGMPLTALFANDNSEVPRSDYLMLII